MRDQTWATASEEPAALSGWKIARTLDGTPSPDALWIIVASGVRPGRAVSLKQPSLLLLVVARCCVLLSVACCMSARACARVELLN